MSTTTGPWRFWVNMIIQGVTLNGTRVVDGGVMPTGLVLYLDANNTSSYSGSGTTLNDLSGNGYTHTLSDSSLYTTLSGVKCFNCSSTGQVITANSTTIQIPQNFTYISWARVRSSASGYRTLLRCYAPSTGNHPIIINADTNILGMYDNATVPPTGFNSSGYDMSAYGDVWAQWATTGDATSQRFYINGRQVGSGVAKTSSGQYHYAWGNIQTASDQPWGYVANLELYNFKLSLEQLQQNYYGLRGRFGV
jgi:Concanavalin A-like lectin/glucanases superfamily